MFQDILKNNIFFSFVVVQKKRCHRNVAGSLLCEIIRGIPLLCQKPLIFKLSFGDFCGFSKKKQKPQNIVQIYHYKNSDIKRAILNKNQLN